MNTRALTISSCKLPLTATSAQNRGINAPRKLYSYQQKALQAVTICASSSEDSQPTTSGAPEDDIDLLIEKQIAKRRPNKNKADATPQQFGPKVIAPTRDAVYGGGPLTSEQKFENGFVSVLAFFFLVILVEGIFLGVSGFLNEAADQFAQDKVYPAFSPTVAIFLILSTAYGLWKTGGGRSGDNN